MSNYEFMESMNLNLIVYGDRPVVPYTDCLYPNRLKAVFNFPQKSRPGSIAGVTAP